MKKTGTFVASLSISLSAVAMLEPMPEESGFSGFASLGGSVVRVENSMIAGNDFKQISDDTIGSITDGPDSKTVGTVAFGGEIKYTFASTRTQVFFGNSLEDWIRYDFSYGLGVRQQVRDWGTVEGSILFTSFPTQVWEDPYVENAKRNETERTSTGARIGLYNIGGALVDLQFSARKIELDSELSGVTLNVIERDLLSREGDEYKTSLTYDYVIGEGHVVSPEISVVRYDLNGAAMEGYRYGLQFTHLYNTGNWTFISNLGATVSKYEEDNPIYDEKRDSTSVGGSFTTVYSKLFGVDNLGLRGSLVYYDENSDIAFYDASLLGATVSTVYRF